MSIGDGVGRLVEKCVKGDAGAIDAVGRAPFEVLRGCCLRRVPIGLAKGLTTGELLVTETRTGPPLLLPDFALLDTPFVTRSAVARRFIGGRPFITGVCGSTILPCLTLPWSAACACACACAAFC